MKVLISYIKKRVRYLVLQIVLTGIMAVMLWLYGMPADGVCYGAVLTAAVLFLVGAADLYFYQRKYAALRNLSAAIPHELRDFPDASDLVEEEYQEIAQNLFAVKAILENDMKIGKKDMQDYYSLWVHQIKTPLAAMHLLLQSFEEDEHFLENEETAAASQSFLKEMKLKLFQTEQYVELVLSYLRLEDMSSDLVLQWYSAREIARQAVRKYSQVFILKKLRLDFRVGEQMVLTDEKWMVFVIEQLLSNALKYTQSGTISVYMEGLELIVEDTGIGIQKEDLPRIFDRGFTGYNGRMDKKSTGIGLYLCRSICQRLGHRIKAESEPGKGTKFIISMQREELGVE